MAPPAAAFPIPPPPPPSSGAAFAAETAAAAADVYFEVAAAALRGVVAKHHIVQRDVGRHRLAGIAAAGHKQAAAEPSTAAGGAAAGAADCLHVLQRQVLDRDVARIDEETTLRAAAVEHRARGAGDRQRDAGVEIDRFQRRADADGAAGDVDLLSAGAGSGRVDRFDRRVQLGQSSDIIGRHGAGLPQRYAGYAGVRGNTSEPNGRRASARHLRPLCKL